MKIAAVILNLDLTMDLTMDLNEVHLLDLTLVIINRRSAAVKICRKFHESNFENIFLVAINSHLAAVEKYRKNSRRF